MAKIALVTGSSRGIGKGIALELAKAGYDVGVHYSTTKEGAEDTVKQIRALGRRAELFHADLRDLSQIAALFDAFFAQFDHIDLLVNNAGITRFAPFLEMTPEMFQTVFDTDLRGMYFCAQAAARRMVADGIKGVIINISSNHAKGCWPGATAYAAAKAGAEKMGQNMAMELAKYGIRVVTICPGYTELPERTVPTTEAQKAGRRKVESRIPMNRFAVPAEIGRAVIFLAGENAGYITGTSLYIDGGSLLPVLAQNDFI